ncbi:MAG TPA: exodeoxyribonuclease III [Desulfurivibrionaceae bacterium]|nr:exodeoxyribonuclease III [Desulfurivibrionaceae bacterium]
MLTLYSWNVNGLRAAARKGFLDWLQATRPDILAVQETKCHPDQLTPDLRRPEGYHTYWAWAERKGYSGLGLYTRQEPLSVEMGLGFPEYDREGRTIVAEYPDFVLLAAYFPNGGRDLSRVPFKMAYKRDFLAACNRWRTRGKEVIFCGDVNTAHREMDLARPRQNQQHTGFLPEERAWIDQVLAEGYIDSYRALHPEESGAYTWWSYIGGARSRNVGWRLDYFFVAPGLWSRVAAAGIHANVFGSDHCPVSLSLEPRLPTG